MTSPYRVPNVIHDGPAAITITLQQARILDGIVLGLTDAQVATHLFVTYHTVRTHVRRLLLKLGARNRAHAVALVLSDQVAVDVKS